MCNRAQRGEPETIRATFGARMFREFNEGPLVVHPKDPGLVVLQHEGQRVVDQMTWGFPVSLKSTKTGLPLKPKPVNNARFDKLGGFWRRWTGVANRCLIPTARFAEAIGPKGSMTEAWLSLPDQPVFAWAGLWTDSAEWGRCYTGVMTDNAPELADIHDRSPVILDPADWETWLTAPLDMLYQFDRPYPADRIKVERTAIPWVKRPPSAPALL
ncbi:MULTISPECIES: SOS response-associated peptidase [unclassified Sphingobium]|uniref:SOS response-associated peptidase n=1 Tax=unclassified Sphingobium TaxID=2611147 RepID=UPI002224B7F5|nr:MULTISPECIES: SOS response-associated peptidase family protein [unclassified Sphingobium]MCW2386945.1 putative SOS response-associated peptidase YedK [Sphingobium sp. B2D3D]